MKRKVLTSIIFVVYLGILVAFGIFLFVNTRSLGMFIPFLFFVPVLFTVICHSAFLTTGLVWKKEEIKGDVIAFSIILVAFAVIIVSSLFLYALSAIGGI